MRPLRIVTVRALSCTGPFLVWGGVGQAGPAVAAPPAGFSPGTRQASPASQQEVPRAGVSTLPGAAGGDWLARAYPDGNVCKPHFDGS